MTRRPPNLLILMADQMAAPALPFYGHPVVRAPNLTALAGQGVVFDSAYCPSPLCAPSRAALMTGQLCSRTGAFDNAAELPASIPTFAHALRDLGYDTCLCGKMHFVGPDQLHGFEERLTTDIYPADMGWTANWEQPDERPSWYHNMLSIVQAGACATSNQLDFDDEVAFQAVRKLHTLARSEKRPPFCLVVSFTHPHDPYAMTRPYWDRYDPSEIDLPAVPPLPWNQLDPHARRVHAVCDLGRYQQTPDRVRAARHGYYASISYVDDRVGQILQALATTGLDQDTIVLFTSDHGDMLGERGLWYKMVFFEWAARVPLIVHAPGRFAPGRVAAPVSLVDLLPTLTEMAAGHADRVWPCRLDGSSLVPLLEGREAGADRSVVSEILCEGALAPCFMIRRGPWKYIHSSADPDLLFDLDADPHERCNLAARTDHSGVVAGFRAEVQARWDEQALHLAVLDSQRRRRFVASSLARGRRTAWDHQPTFDASEAYMRGHLDLDSLERRARFPVPSTPPPDGPAVSHMPHQRPAAPHREEVINTTQ